MQALSFSTFAETQLITDFVAHVQSSQETYPHLDYDQCKIIKIEQDLDSNNKIDYLLSSDCPYENNTGWGNSGGAWKVYLAIDDDFIQPEPLFFHPRSVQFTVSATEGEFYLHTNLRKNCCQGLFTEYLITQNTKTLIKQMAYQEMNIKGSPGSNKYDDLFIQTKPPSPTKCLIKEITSNTCTWQQGY